MLQKLSVMNTNAEEYVGPNWLAGSDKYPMQSDEFGPLSFRQ
jgi:hypothetical protein